MKDMDSICKDWKDIWASKIVHCGEEDNSIRSLPPSSPGDGGLREPWYELHIHYVVHAVLSYNGNSRSYTITAHACNN